MQKRRGMVYTLGFTFALTFVITLLLSATNTFVAPKVAENEILRHRRTVLAALGESPENPESIDRMYADLVRLEALDRGLYVRRTEETEDALALRFSGPGVWGEVTGVISVDPGVTRVRGLKILDHNETPGLGGRITGDEFLNQFRDERIGDEGIAWVPRGPGDYDPENATVHGITGATGTSRAFLGMINDELRRLRELVAKGLEGGAS